MRGGAPSSFGRARSGASAVLMRGVLAPRAGFPQPAGPTRPARPAAASGRPVPTSVSYLPPEFPGSIIGGKFWIHPTQPKDVCGTLYYILPSTGFNCITIVLPVCYTGVNAK